MHYQGFKLLCTHGIRRHATELGYPLGFICDDAFDLLSRMLVADPRARYTIEQVLHHRFFTASPHAAGGSTEQREGGQGVGAGSAAAAAEKKEEEV